VALAADRGEGNPWGPEHGGDHRPKLLLGISWRRLAAEAVEAGRKQDLVK